MKYLKYHIDKLRNIIYLHNYQYYILNNPLSNDVEYDLILQRLNLLENRYPLLYKQTSPTTILSPLLNNIIGCYPIRYHFPMLSLQTILTPHKLYYFFKNIPKELINLNKIEFCCELKIDGVAINLIYKQNKLIFSGTRGNGYYGENITKNIFLIHNIPKYLVISNPKQDYILPEYCEIRGEIFITKKDFIFLKNNAERFNIQHLIYNSRNLASGLLQKREDDCSYNNIVPHQLLKFYAYNFLFDEQKDIILSNILNNHWNILKFLRLMNFSVCKYSILYNTPEEINLYYKLIKSKIDKISLEIDGVVIKVNNLKLQKYLGWDNKYPRWAIAIKFPPNNKITYLRNIQWKMSRYGVITPLAMISPINIAGTTINQLNLHNYKIINKLDLRLNDAIMIYRAGEVIPKIYYVIKSFRYINYPHVKHINIPSHCSLCKSLIRVDAYNNILCTGNIFFCKKQFHKTITHFLYAFNIKAIGDNLIALLIEQNIISTPVDILFLTEKELMGLNLEKKRVKYIKDHIQLYKSIPLKNIIYSLGINNLGWGVAKKLALGLNSLNKLLKCDIYEFKKTSGILGKMSEKIFNYIKENDIRYLVIKLIKFDKIKIIS